MCVWVHRRPFAGRPAAPKALTYLARGVAEAERAGRAGSLAAPDAARTGGAAAATAASVGVAAERPTAAWPPAVAGAGKEKKKQQKIIKKLMKTRICQYRAKR